MLESQNFNQETLKILYLLLDKFPSTESLMREAIRLDVPSVLSERRGALLNFEPQKQLDFFEDAIREGGYETALYLLQHWKENPTIFSGAWVEKSLFTAVRLGSREIVLELVSFKVNINAMEDNDRTPLLIAAERGDLEICSTLLAAGAEVNVMDSYKRIPVHYAAMKGFDAILGELIHAGSNILHADKEGATPLHLAARGSNESAIHILLDAGAAVDVRDCAGQTAMHLTAESGNVPALLALLCAGGDPFSKDDEGMEPIHYAARGDSGHVCMIRELLSIGADPNAMDSNGETPVGHCLNHHQRRAPSTSVFQALMGSGGKMKAKYLKNNKHVHDWLHQNFRDVYCDCKPGAKEFLGSKSEADAIVV
jgi:ankyrin repeat protein